MKLRRAYFPHALRITTVVLAALLLGAGASSSPTDPVPFITGIFPVSIAPGVAATSVTINGANFASSPVVYWASTPLAVTYISPSRIVVTIPPALSEIASVGLLTVQNPGNPIKSNVVYLPVSPPAASVTFAQTNFPAANSPLELVQADLNGDDIVDLVVTNNATNSVAVFLGNLDGTFQAEVNYAVDAMPYGLAVGDFNGDGQLDLVVGHDNNGNQTLNVLLGNGDGTFQSRRSVAVPGDTTRHPAVADLNGDGNLDIVVSNESTAEIYVLLGKGDGTFQPAQTTTVPFSGPNVSVSDFNEDGILDLAIAGNASQNIYVFLGHGDGTFSPAEPHPATMTPYFVRAADINSDGHVDLLVSSQNSSGAILLGQGDGTFQTVSGTPPQPSYSLDTGDLNTDGWLDVIGDSGGSPITYLGNGDGSLGDGHYTSNSNQSYSTIVAPFGGGIGGLGLATTDYNNNSLIILLQTVSLSPSVLSFSAQGIGAASPAQVVTINNPTPRAVSISGISLASGNAGDFTQTNNCGTTLAASASCTISVSFLPTASGPRTTVLTFASDAPGGPQTLNVSGTAVDAATVLLSQNGINFGSQLVSVAGPPQTVTLQNSGNLTLAITSITITGTGSSDFTQTNDCGSAVLPGAHCTITITFTPAAVGSRSASVSLASSAASSPDVVTLEGAGQDFSLGLSGAPVVAAGTEASYELMVTPLGGFNQPVTLACSGAPALATCVITPNSVTPDGSHAAPAGVVIATTARSLIVPVDAPSKKFLLTPLRVTLPVLLVGLVAFLAVLVGSRRLAPAGRSANVLFATATLLVVSLAVAACGGRKTPSGGTPAGTYTITITATSGSLTHTATAQLTVN